MSTVLSLHRLIDYGLRDYGTAEWVGGDPNCEHTVSSGDNDNLKTYVTRPERDGVKRQYCQKCGAVRVDNQIGLEQSPDDYVAAMVQVFREVWRVLRDDGTVWLNLGDSYASVKSRYSSRPHTLAGHARGDDHDMKPDLYHYAKTHNIKDKDLIGIPWRVAFALQADGWWLRQDIIWHKPNPMPESVKDRCTKAHEYIFLLTKQARYWYDNEAIKEPSAEPDDNRGERGNRKRFPTDMIAGIRGPGVYPMANKRSVWTVTTKPYPGSHYAVFPPDLIEPCILAGCPETVCAECGAPYERVVENTTHFEGGSGKAGTKADDIHGKWEGKQYGKNILLGPVVETKTLGFQPTCDCDAGTKPGVVLDPFAGSGTTLMVARKHRRNAIGLDLNFDYLTTNARERLQYGGYVPIADGINQLTIGV